MNLDTISCRVIRSCLDYASSKNIEIEDIMLRHGYSYELIEDSYNWVSVHFLNEVINKITSETLNQNIAFEIGCDSTNRNSWGDIENVIKAIGSPKPILMHVEKFSSYFLKPALIKLENSDTDSVTIRYEDKSGEYLNALEFVVGAMISIPKLWGANELSAVRLADGSIRINFSTVPSFFDPNNDYKKFSPKLLEEIIIGLEKTKKIIEQKNKELEKKNSDLEKAYLELEQGFNSKIQNEKMAVIGQLSAGLAHEVNNPLSFIISNIKTLKKYMNSMLENIQKNQKPSPEIILDLPDLIAETEEGAIRVKKLIEDINHLSHTGLGEKTYANLQDIISSALRITNNVHKGSIKIKEDYSHRNKIICSPSRLNQVFVNLILNSISAIQERHKHNISEGSISVETKENTESIEVSISDNGTGINPKNIYKVFEPFFTTKKAGEGTGLGLSTSLAIINAHNGSIKIESQLKQGTKIIILFPKYHEKTETIKNEPSLF
jgi:signal transduction histidine kinase